MPISKLQHYHPILHLCASICSLFLLSALPAFALEPSFNDQKKVSNQLSTADLQHGAHQIKKLLLDRPELTLRVSKGDSVYQWMLRNFAGEHTGYRIYWENSNPSNGGDAENRFDDYAKRGAIRVKKLRNLDAFAAAERQCTALVYELINIRNTSRFRILWKKALAAELTKQEWVRGNVLLEFEAMRETQNFYRTIWLPLMKSKQMNADAHMWRADSPSNFDSWFQTTDADKFIRYWSNCYPHQ